MRRERDRLVEQRLVRHDASGLDAARRRQDEGRRGVVDAGGQFLCGEAPEHHGVDGANPGAREHGDHRLRDHRHIDDHAVAARDALRRQRPRHPGHFVPQLGVRVPADGIGHGAVIDERQLFPAPAVDVVVEGVVARVELTAGEPAVERGAAVVAHAIPAFRPRKRLGGSGPESLRVGARSAIDVRIGTHEWTSYRRGPTVPAESPWVAAPSYTISTRRDSNLVGGA